jgi:protein-S-isoprenylcysteine O-methyltransferase Ste14
MFPILVDVYRRLAIREERDVAAAFCPAWSSYAAMTPRFLPRRSRRTGATTPRASGLERS